ncbi:MAG: ExbD/TolR family protein [Muribaculaceae bacterium]
MALKRSQEMISGFSMASMTDVIFLLLVFFMVTSTYVFPTALEVNLPEGTEQTPEKPSTRVFVDAQGAYYVSFDDQELAPVPADSLATVLNAWAVEHPDDGIAVYADVDVAYGKVVEVLNLGAANSLKMVLATRPGATQSPAINSPQQ